MRKRIVIKDGTSFRLDEGWTLPEERRQEFETLLGKCCDGFLATGDCLPCQEGVDKYVTDNGREGLAPEDRASIVDTLVSCAYTLQEDGPITNAEVVGHITEAAALVRDGLHRGDELRFGPLPVDPKARQAPHVTDFRTLEKSFPEMLARFDGNEIGRTSIRYLRMPGFVRLVGKNAAIEVTVHARTPAETARIRARLEGAAYAVVGGGGVCDMGPDPNAASFSLQDGLGSPTLDDIDELDVIEPSVPAPGKEGQP